jgi:hypothetical protein
MVFAATLDADKFVDDIWICDSGATSHDCVSDIGMFDVRNIDEKIRVGNGNLLVATKIEILNLDVTTSLSLFKMLNFPLSFGLIYSASIKR